MLLLPRVLRGSTSRRRWATAHSAEALADAAWSEVRATAVDLDLDWSDQRTVRANGLVVQREVVPTYEGRRAIDDVVTFVELTRYARPRELSEDTRARIEQDVEHLARGGLPGGGPQAGPAGALVPALGDPGRSPTCCRPGGRGRVAERRATWWSEAVLVAPALPALLEPLHEALTGPALGSAAAGASRLAAAAAALDHAQPGRTVGRLEPALGRGASPRRPDDLARR